MKATDKSAPSKRAIELLTLAVIENRNAQQAYIEGLRANPGTARFAERMAQHVDTVDYATAALASELGWSITPGCGGSVSDELVAEATKWVQRGKRDPIKAE